MVCAVECNFNPSFLKGTVIRDDKTQESIKHVINFRKQQQTVKIVHVLLKPMKIINKKLLQCVCAHNYMFKQRNL
jgi:hypothetical protein